MTPALLTHLHLKLLSFFRNETLAEIVSWNQAYVTKLVSWDVRFHAGLILWLRHAL